MSTAALRHRYGRAFGMKQAETTPEFEVAFTTFMREAQRKIDEHYDEFFKEARQRTGDPTFGAEKLTAERGPRYIRIVKEAAGGGTSGRSAYVFIDTKNGDILKSASWKTPAKHARGSIFDTDPTQAVTAYGARYLRR